MKKKIVLIGAGSVVFTQGLIADMLRTFDCSKWQLGLVDIEENALEIAVRLCKKVLKVKKSELELIYSTDRCDVLDGADYVVTTIGVGGRRAWEKDVFIPRKYGIYQPVGDSVMPGGISRGMRMIPAMLEIVKDVKKLCPGAYFFNYSNPMTFICRAIRKKTDFPIIGLCHGVKDTERKLANFIGVNEEEVSSYTIGLNHLTFMTDFLYQGKDAWPMVRERFNKEKKSNHPDEPLTWEIFEKFGVYPLPGDRHITEFYPERFPKGKYYGKQLGIDAYSFERTIQQGDEGYEYMKELAFSKGDLPDKFFERFSGEHEQLMDIIDSIEGDLRKVFSMNLPNQGTIAGVPDYSVLEMLALATAKGIFPLKAIELNDELMKDLNKHIEIAELVVDAALKGDRKLFAQAILMGGYIEDSIAVARMVDEMIMAQKPYLPQF